MEETIESGKEIQIASAAWDFQIIINNLPFPISLDLYHDDLMRKIIVLKIPVQKSDEDKAMEAKLKEYEGMEI